MSLCSQGHRYHGPGCPVCRPALTPTLAANTTARGYGWRWQKLSSQARRLKPWGNVCDKTTDLPVDPLDPATRGRADLTLNDVQVLCRSCNSRKATRFFGKGGSPD